MLPAIAAAGLADAVDGFCEGIAFSPEQIARSSQAAQNLGLPVKLHADQLSNLGGAALAASFGALSVDHLEYTDKAGAIAMAGAGSVAVILPGAYYFIRETKKPPIDLFRGYGVKMAVATDCNPGTSPLTSLLLTMNMAATLFGMTVDECLAGVTREAARALGLLSRDRHAGGRKIGRSRHLGHREPGRARLPHRVQPASPPRLERPMTEIVLKPGNATLADWRAIYRGAVPRLDPACGPKIAASAAAVARIVAKGEPVYGINTGFGKLASVRIPADDLETLQRNIVLSHAAGVGEAMPVSVTRLMMALKLASLAQGASGVKPETIALLRGDAGQRRRPGGAGAGLGRRVGRSCAAGAHDGGDDRRRRLPHAARHAFRPRWPSCRTGWSPWCSAPRKAWRC